MVFSSLVFLGLFLPITLVIYYLLYALFRDVRWLNSILLLASLFFYAWGEPVWVFVLIMTALLDYGNGRRIDRYRVHGKLRWHYGVLSVWIWGCYFA